ncbi:hypothetical protein BRADI_3g55621v3 [Brachypodium distachyon]|uniref:F-box associated domain-containing protein n=1 Tax=Brachypodium distachyon TaxID=15368 RepID=A0A2K2D592_BRADI|nr:hypothetical protein BRADI_3g55621v3 [Brachypodium distachyon]
MFAIQEGGGRLKVTKTVLQTKRAIGHSKNKWCIVSSCRRFHLETGRWTAMQNKLAQEIVLLREPPCVFLNGIMYLSSLDCRIIMVDIERKTWREIEWLVDMAHRTEIVTIGQSLGILHAWLTYKDNGSSQVQLYVWVLEDIASRRWTLKHTATNILELFGRECYNDEESFRAFAIHPDRNLIYITDYG